ncbi:hypothetical protein ACOMHN_018967 [Nucella lapillus]
MAVCWRQFLRNTHVLLGSLLILALMTSLWLTLPLAIIQSFDDVLRVRLPAETVPNLTRTGGGEEVVLSSVFGARWSHYQAVCESGQVGGGVPGLVQNPLVYLPANLTVCWVPKKSKMDAI